MQLLMPGSPAFNMLDNVAYQPGRGNWIIHEDADTTYSEPHNNDLWDCLPDGPDDDLLSDGCIRIATLNDRRVDGRHLRRHRHALLRQHPAQRLRLGTVFEITGWR